MSALRHISKWALLAGLVSALCVSLITVHIWRKHRQEKLDEADDRAVIVRGLNIPAEAVHCERLMIDDYRGYYCVYFTAQADPAEIANLSRNREYKDYGAPSQEKHNLVLHARNYKYLKQLAWGPVQLYEHSPQYIGVWEKEYLVYLAVSNGQIFGYFQNKYNDPGGPGPFQ